MKNDVLMNVCVELKNVHHANLKHGIETQLPLYIKLIKWTPLNIGLLQQIVGNCLPGM